MKDEVFTAAQVAELLDDLLYVQNIGRRASWVIKMANRHSIGTRWESREGRVLYEFSNQDVDILTRMLEKERALLATHPHSIKDVAARTGQAKETVNSKIKALGLGVAVGPRIMLSDSDVEQIENYNPSRGSRWQEQYSIDDPEQLGVTQMAEVLADEFEHLTEASLKDKIRRFAQNGVAGKRDPQKDMWIFSKDDVTRLAQAMRAGLVAARS